MKPWESSKDEENCGSTCGQRAISPATATLPSRGTQQLSATGGSGTYTWKLLDGGSGGTVSATGLFTAGSTGSTTDTIVVTDSLGATASATVTISAALAISLTSHTFDVGVGAPPDSYKFTFIATGGQRHPHLVGPPGRSRVADAGDHRSDRQLHGGPYHLRRHGRRDRFAREHGFRARHRVGDSDDQLPRGWSSAGPVSLRFAGLLALSGITFPDRTLRGTQGERWGVGIIATNGRPPPPLKAPARPASPAATAPRA